LRETSKKKCLDERGKKDLSSFWLRAGKGGNGEKLSKIPKKVKKGKSGEM